MPNLLAGHTTEQLRALLRKGEKPAPPPKARHTPQDRFRVLAKCTSTTAASGSGIGAECFPAVIVSTDPNELVSAQPTYATVWLTVIQGGASVTPTSGAWYECELAGEFDPGSDPRLRTICGAGPAASGTTLSMGGDTTLRTFTVTNSGTYANTGWTMTLPSAGSYILFANLTASLQITTFGAFTPEWISVRLHDGTASVPRSSFMAVSAYVTGVNYTQSMGFMTVYTATGATTITLQAKTRGGSTIAGASIWSGSPVDDPTSDIRYLKFA